MSEPYMSKDTLYEFLCEEHADQILHIDASEEFLAETIFINYWNDTFSGVPAEEGIDVEIYPLENGSKLVFRITCDEDFADPIRMVYTPSTENPGKHELEISIGEHLFYWRTADQDPATEWHINALANELTDANGDYIFPGEPIRE